MQNTAYHILRPLRTRICSPLRSGYFLCGHMHPPGLFPGMDVQRMWLEARGRRRAPARHHSSGVRESLPHRRCRQVSEGGGRHSAEPSRRPRRLLRVPALGFVMEISVGMQSLKARLSTLEVRHKHPRQAPCKTI